MESVLTLRSTASAGVTTSIDTTFDRAAASFDNPDRVGIMMHDYRGHSASRMSEQRRETAYPKPTDHRSANYARGRRQRRPARRPQRMREEGRKLHAPGPRRTEWAQAAAGSVLCLRRRHHRDRRMRPQPNEKGRSLGSGGRHVPSGSATALLNSALETNQLRPHRARRGSACQGSA